MRRRITSLLLLITMLLTSFVFAAETDTTEAPINERYVKQSAMLQALGIFKNAGKEAESKVSRSDFAAVIMDLLGARDLNAGDADYLDVSKGHPNYNAVAFAKAWQVMNGVNAYQFEPDRVITYAEAVKTLLSAMGYADLAERKGGYPNGYIAVAGSLGFDIAAGSLTWEQTADMLVHALDCYVLSAVSIENPSGRILYSSESKETILSVYHKILHVTGKVTDNGLTSLTAPSALRGKAVVIGGETFQCNDAAIRRALGSDIDFYYKDANSEQTLLWWDYAHQTEPLVLPWDCLNIHDSQFVKTNVSYFEKDKIKQAKIDPRAAFIYNEIVYPAFTVADMKLTDGTLTLCDGDGDGVYDVLYADVYRSFRVKTFNNAKEEFMDDFNQVIDVADYETVEVYNDSAMSITTADIALNTVLSAYESKNKEYVKLQVSTAKATGVYQKSDVNQSRTVYTIDGTDYMASEALQKQINAQHVNMPTLKPGERYRLYLDFNNDIAAFELLSEVESYAYFTAARKKSGISDTVELQVVLEDGQTAVLPCADKVRVNRGVASKAADLMSLADLKNSAGEWAPQLIKIKTNAQGRLYEMETAPNLSTDPIFKNVGFNPYRFSMVFSNQSTSLYADARRMITGGGKQYSVSADTVFFLIPPDGNTDYIEVTHGVPSKLPITQMQGYDAGADYSLGALVVYLKENDGTTDRTEYLTYLYIVSKVGSVVDAEGTELTQLTAFSHSQEWRMVEQRPDIIPDDIKAGDIVRLAVDNFDRVTRCTKIVSTDVRPAPNAFNLEDTTRSRSAYNGYKSVAWGYPVGVGANSITISTDEVGGSIIHVPFYSSGSAFIEFDAKNLKYKTITKAQLPITASLNAATGYFDISDKNTMVLVTTSSSGGYDFIVMKFGE